MDFSKSGLAWGVAVVLLVMAPMLVFASVHGGAVDPNVPTVFGIRVEFMLFALVVFKGKVHIGYIAGIVAASNAGGAGSVVGDTTTTMMWITDAYNERKGK